MIFGVYIYSSQNKYNLAMFIHKNATIRGSLILEGSISVKSGSLCWNKFREASCSFTLFVGNIVDRRHVSLVGTRLGNTSRHSALNGVELAKALGIYGKNSLVT